ncbi:MAG: tRNA (guanosine(37)-N1)-methyltransferase TrmD [Patescibacteria group bacterium]|nr:tRNA (guanosine(37)-N1)-methyltransferase TrmD [Patescibacteria group bacterium]
MRFDILTIFPGLFKSFLKESLIAKAIKNDKISLNIHNIRDFSRDKHNTVDDKPYGGGPGMVLMVEPIYKCLKSIKRLKESKTIILTPKGRNYKQKTAFKYSQLDQLILICGRYEGFDERIKEFVDGELSIGNYITMGGEIPSMVIVESVARLIPGVLGDKESVIEESFAQKKDYLEYPQYTRPAEYKGLKVPKILLSGDHKKIRIWRQNNSRTKK